MGIRQVGIAAATVALAAALSGCVVFKGPVRVKQIGDKPKVRVTFTICNSDADGTAPVCPDPGNSGDEGFSGATNSGEEVLLALRVPRGTETPDRIRSRTEGVSGAFERFREYGRQLNEIAPRREGYRWVGYSAPPYDAGDEGNDSSRYDKARFKVTLRVPDRLVGKRFKVRPVVGWWDDADVTASRGGMVVPGLMCGPDPFESYDDDRGHSTICIDSPSRAETRRSVKVKIEPRS